MFEFEQRGLFDLQRSLQALKLPPKQRQAIHRALARKVSGYARQHIRHQESPDGAAFAARKEPDPAYDDGKKRGKMLKRIARAKHMKEFATPELGKTYWKDGLMGTIATRQQEGGRFPITNRSRKGRHRDGKDGWGGDHATKRQALRLLSLGYRTNWRRGSKQRDARGYWKPSAKWIQSNLTINVAGWLIRYLEAKQGLAYKHGHARQRGEGKLPPRAFLGVNQREMSEMDQYILDALTRYYDVVG